MFFGRTRFLGHRIVHFLYDSWLSFIRDVSLQLNLFMKLLLFRLNWLSSVFLYDLFLLLFNNLFGLFGYLLFLGFLLLFLLWDHLIFLLHIDLILIFLNRQLLHIFIFLKFNGRRNIDDLLWSRNLLILLRVLRWYRFRGSVVFCYLILSLLIVLVLLRVLHIRIQVILRSLHVGIEFFLGLFESF